MLQSLELFGFKSFADRVEFAFDPGITCVVGPNGSGKSNVVDAIKWLLGDQSAKSLRGSEMSDVIFNGSSSRGGSGYAEAVLTFDNNSGLIPFAAREVAVGRRLYRSGESEYLLNGESVRLKDVRALFLGTGAGSAAYSIIEQGRVGQILQANPAARRAVFEEAAGVSKFKARRVEAERRLARVATNLERLSDIVDETETRLAATRSQASKAAKYRELTKLLREQWLGLAGDRYRVLTERIERLTEQESVDAATDRELEAAVAELATRSESLTAELASAERELSTGEAESSRRRETLAGLRSTLRAKRQQAAELDEELARVSRDRWDELSSRSERLSEIERAAEGVRLAAEGRAEVSEQQSEIEATIEKLESDRVVAERDRSERQETIDALEAERVTRGDEQRQIDQQVRLIDRERGKLDTQLSELVNSVHAEGTRVDKLRDEAAIVSRDHAIVRDQLNDLRSQDESLKQQLESTKQILADAREQKTAAEARLSVLRDLEPSSGHAVSARELLDRAASTPGEPWDSIVGRVGDLIECAVEDAPLLDLALGPRAHLIATRNLTAMIDYLARPGVELEGRVGFVEVDGSRAVSAGDGSTSDLFNELDALYTSDTRENPSSERGVIARVDALVRGNESLSAAVLGDTWLVERLETARSLNQRYPRCRFLTRVGELIDTDGSYHFGQLPPHVALIGRRAEIRELRARVARFARSIEDAGRRLETLAEQREDVKTQLRAAESQQPAAVERAGRSQSTLATAIERLESLRKQSEAIEADTERLDNERVELISQNDAATSRVAECAAQCKIAAAEIEQLDETIYRISRERAACEEQLRDLSVRAATLDARHTSEAERLARLQSDIGETDARVARFVSRAADVTEKQADLTLAILNTRAARDVMLLEHERQSSLLGRLHEARGRIRSAVETVRDEQSRVDAEHRDVVARRTQSEMQLRESTADLERLAERCDEDFSITLDEAAEAPSAYAKFCDDLPEGVERPDFDEVADALEQDAQRTRRKIKTLGSVNTDSLQDLDDLETRFETLSAQLNDLNIAKTTLEEIIERTNTESRRMFTETFETVRGYFQELFRKCFGGGSADLVLEETEDVMEAGIDILARPPGKELRNLSLLSGGEKAMTAVALLMALFRAKPSPYCILDEVDAPLDEANIDRFLNVLREFREETQFVIITHRRRTMTSADVIYGVTMETSGVSKRLAVNLDQVAEDGSVKEAA